MILCGTDLSVASEPALQCAAALARKRSQELLLVTVLERDNPTERMTAGVRLEQDAAQLRQTFDIQVETFVAHGAPDSVLAELAADRDVELIVVGAEGSRRSSRRLGSVPEHLCQLATVPVFVARRSEGVLEWSKDKRQLRTLVGSGLGEASRSALSFIGAWPDLALTVAHIAWPYGEHYRLGVAGPMPLDHLRPEVHHQLLGDLGRWAAETPCANSPKLRVTPGWGRVDSHLAQLATEKEADLLVIGSHQRNRAERIWHGSTSRNAIHEATCNVLCVPQRLAPARVATAPRSIVVPTDFSVLADRAVAYGYAVVEPGGVVHLVHVASDPDDAQRKSLGSELAARIPAAARSRGVTTEVRVLNGAAPWLAIWQYAGRASADMICMATRSRDAAATLLLGSQAQAMLQHSRIPVLLVPPDRED